MKHIVQINVDANNGSNGGIARSIGHLVLTNGWESTIVYGRKMIPDTSNLIHIGNKCDILLHVLETRIFDNHGLSSRMSTKRLIKKLQKLKPDIIHLHNIHGYYINYKLLFEYIKANNIPVVWTLHDCWSFTGHCAHFLDSDCEKWQFQCENCNFINHYPKSWFIDASKKNFDLKKTIFTSIPNMTLVPVSTWLEKLLYKSFLKEVDIITIHNGIDLSIFHPKSNAVDKLGLSNDKFIILGVANIWTNQKGLNEFIQLSTNPKYQVILIGTDEKTRKLIPPNIIAIDRTENQEVLADFYSAADIFLNPTYSDTFPTVNLEALACGTPVVTYNTGGSPEAIDQQTGIVVPRGDFKELESAILNLSQLDHEKKLALRTKCRERAKALFDKDLCYAKYLKLYKTILHDV